VTTCSTHALDAALGRPAAGIDVVLTGAGVRETATTDTDGRVRFAAELAPGPYAVTFATGPWFASAERTTFFPEVAVAFEVAPGEQHYHVALLLSPFSYTTYRGS
jgi:5-hydroxyisourate hydrolase